MSKHIPLELTITIGRKQLSWPACMERPEFDSILKALVERLGEPSYRIIAGDVGPNRREITVEPIPEKTTEPITVPEPVPA